MEANLKKTSENPIVNAFSTDVEGFVESNLQSFHIPDKYINQPEGNGEIEQNTNAVLEILDEVDVKATFFFLGRIAKDIPKIVKETAQAGHEIACHNYGKPSYQIRNSRFSFPLHFSVFPNVP
jgi:peptidoglycan/xylan/chitin deacetylase (PgdA/CDA1 family)